MDTILQRMEAHGVLLKAKKCSFATKEVHYMGHVVDGQGVWIAPTSIAAIHDMPMPDTQKKLRAFLGLANFWRGLCPDLLGS